MDLISFVNFENLERKCMGSIRKKVNLSENRKDLELAFSQSITAFLNQAFQQDISFSEDDVIFRPNMKVKYALSSRLMNTKVFIEAWEHSNLPHFINQIADTTYHKYIHMGKHGEKTDRKIRQTDNRSLKIF